MSEICSLFPTPLLHARQLLPGRLVERIGLDLLALAKTPNQRSHALAHTAALDDSRMPELAELRTLVQPKLQEFGVLLFGEPLPWLIKELWGNVLAPGGHQAMHNHANSFVSGVIYLSTPHPDAGTVFIRPPSGNGFVFSNEHRSTRPGPFNADKWALADAQAGDLVLFPSYLLHEVAKNPGEQRMTLAFNAIPARLDSWGYTIGFVP